MENQWVHLHCKDYIKFGFKNIINQFFYEKCNRLLVLLIMILLMGCSSNKNPRKQLSPKHPHQNPISLKHRLSFTRLVKAHIELRLLGEIEILPKQHFVPDKP